LLRKITLIILCLLLLTACDQMKPFSPVQPAAQPGDVLFEDDFSGSPTGWGTLGREGGSIGFEYEGMVITVNLPQYLFWSVNGDRYTDARIDVDAVLLSGPTNDALGVICRFQDNDNYYGFMISHDGYYGIYKMIDGQMVMSSAEGNMNFSEAIRQGGVVNHIQVVCEDNILSLIVNDVLLAEVKDDSFSDGRIGLIAGAYDTPGVKVLFDNLRVTQP